jgi:exonuclease SbcC
MTQEKSIRRLQSPIEKIFNQIENLERQKASIKQRFAEAKSRLEVHQTEFAWPKFDKNDRESFEKHFAQVNKNQAEIKEIEAAIKVLTGRIEVELLKKRRRSRNLCKLCETRSYD